MNALIIKHHYSGDEVPVDWVFVSKNINHTMLVQLIYDYCFSFFGEFLSGEFLYSSREKIIGFVENSEIAGANGVLFTVSKL